MRTDLVVPSLSLHAVVENILFFAVVGEGLNCIVITLCCDLCRGKLSLETICLILAYKVKYPENIFLLRGNHECASINRYVYAHSTSVPLLVLGHRSLDHAWECPFYTL